MKHPLKFYIWSLAWRLGWRTWAERKAFHWKRREQAGIHHRMMIEGERGFLERMEDLHQKYDDPGAPRSVRLREMIDQRTARLKANIERFELPDDIPPATLKKS